MWKKVDNQFLCETIAFRPIVELKKENNLEKQWLPYMDMDTVKNIVNGIINDTGEQNEIASTQANHEIHQFVVDCANNIISEMRGA